MKCKKWGHQGSECGEGGLRGGRGGNIYVILFEEKETSGPLTWDPEGRAHGTSRECSRGPRVQFVIGK